MNQLDKTFQRFQSADRQTRLELLLDLSKRLPPLPERYHAARDQGLNQVPECQSPVFLWTELDDGRVRLHADAPPEAPTVRGFVALLGRAVDGATPEEVAAIPGDLLDRLGLSEALGMTRMHGLMAIVQQVKQQVRGLRTED
ncbi:MAG: SufE family protein [Gemmatimonadales bacterium]